MIDFKKIEEEILDFWKKNKIYEKSVSKNKKGEKFYFLQGPPFTSGRLHIGHAWNNNLKDIALRFFRLRGRNVWDRAGYDMHGLPTENKVQKELGLKDKKAIENFGIGKFNQKCKEFSKNNANLMNEDLKRIGIWMDFDNAYLPVENDFMSNEWLLIKKAHEQNRLYKGKKIMYWCGECETSLAKHELEYENVKDNSIFLKFKIKSKKNKDEYLCLWTTTPWTIKYNLAIMVNPELDYIKAEVQTKNGKEIWIVARALAGVFISGLLNYKFKILKEFKGKKLEGIEYEHPFYSKLRDIYDQLKKNSKKVHTIILSKDYVDTTAGTGLVHCAPGCGPEDYEVGKENGIGTFNTLDEKGIILDMGEFSGLKAKTDDPKFTESLKDVGSLIIETLIEHEYPYCWRCHKPVIFRATEQWFMKTEDLVKKVLSYNKKINWVPKKVQNSYEAWVSNLKDNGITRQRYWGTPAPIWECECGHIEIIGSVKELKSKTKDNIPKDLHKPWIDEIKIECKKCKRKIKRIPDILDVWLDSGTASWNCIYYPQRKDLFKKLFPADLIIEASEQARLWFSMLQICSTIAFEKSCFNGVFGHGMILDFQGTKMSKSLGNIISPYKVIDKYSSEILRYYICETKAGENINFNWEDINQKQRNLLVLLNIGNYLTQLKPNKKPKKRGIEERYVLSRLHSSIKKVTNLFETYNFDKTITELEKLFLDVSRVYIKIVRDKEDKEVYEVLKEVYINCLKMFSTICPMITEHIWQELRKKKIVKEESIHLCDWPKSDLKKVNKKLEGDVQIVLDIIERGLAVRDSYGIGLKWPLALAEVKCKEPIKKELQGIIVRQLNVKKIRVGMADNISIKLDTKLTSKLEAEGFSREIIRKIQAARKNAELVKTDLIELEISTEFNDKLRTNINQIKEKVGARFISLEKSKEKFSYIEEGKIKEKSFKIKFNKV
tara:strand:+ start:5730 stop:8570 length:2841 start_codon:yes stop_codon:yes gene_type:complete